MCGFCFVSPSPSPCQQNVVSRPYSCVLISWFLCRFTSQFKDEYKIPRGSVIDLSKERGHVLRTISEISILTSAAMNESCTLFLEKEKELLDCILWHKNYSCICLVAFCCWNVTDKHLLIIWIWNVTIFSPSFAVDGKEVGSIQSQLLCRAILDLYIGEDPFDRQAKEDIRQALTSILQQ